jgi:hypothetical protein
VAVRHTSQLIKAPARIGAPNETRSDPAQSRSRLSAMARHLSARYSPNTTLSCFPTSWTTYARKHSARAFLILSVRGTQRFLTFLFLLHLQPTITLISAQISARARPGTMPMCSPDARYARTVVKTQECSPQIGKDLMGSARGCFCPRGTADAIVGGHHFWHQVDLVSKCDSFFFVKS